jgi:hypothetical protein
MGSATCWVWGEGQAVNDLSAESRLGDNHVDEVMCRMQGAYKKAAIVRFRPLPMRMGMAGARKRRTEMTRRGLASSEAKPVTNVVEFYIPTTFRKRLKVTFQQGRGKLIEFRPPARKSA